MNDTHALIARAQSQADQADRLAAFAEVVRRFQDMAYGCAYAVLGDFHLAEDAAQEAFVTAWRRLDQLREPRAFAGWLRRIVMTRCSRITRRRHVPTTGLDAAAAVASPEPAPPAAAQKREMTDRVLAAIGALPEPQRMVTTLYYINGYSQNQIAEFLELPVTTVKKRLATSRGRLKERMLNMVDETLKSFPLPGDFSDVVVRKAASEADLAGAAEILSYSARKRSGDFESPDNAEKAGIFVVGEKGKVEGAGYFNETQFSIGSTVLRAARPREIGAEAEGVPAPAFVRGALASFKLAAEQGIHIATGHGSQFDHAFCGFVPCFYYPVATLPVAATKGIVTRATVAEADEQQAELARQAWLSDPYAPKMSAYIPSGVPHVVTENGRTVGYISVDRGFDVRRQYDMAFGYVPDATVYTREAALATLRLAGRVCADAGDGTVCMMQSHMTLITQTMIALGGTYLLRGPCDLPGLDAEMVAIIDLPGLAGDLEDAFRERFDRCAPPGLEAALSIEMGGATVGFVAANGELKRVETRQAVHAVLPRWLLTRLLAGFYGGRDVLTMGPIPWDRSDGQTPDDVARDNQPLVLPDPEAALLEALFPKLWCVSWPDPDVWPWVIGREHPMYQHAEAKTPEMRAQIDALRFPWFGR